MQAPAALNPVSYASAPRVLRRPERATSAPIATPYVVSALFAAGSTPGERVDIVVPCHSRPRVTLHYAGARLTQTHQSVLLAVLHAHRDAGDLGATLTLNGRDIIRALGWQNNPASVRRLREHLHELWDCGLEYRNASGEPLAGARILASFDAVQIERITVTLNPALSPAWRVQTYIDLQERRQLRTDVSRWLHSFVAASPTGTVVAFAEAASLAGLHSDYRQQKRQLLAAAEAVCAVAGWTHERLRGGLRFNKPQRRSAEAAS